MAKILSVGPDREVLACRNRALAQLGHEVRGAATRADAIAVARSQAFGVALICNSFPRGYADELAGELQKLLPGAVVLCLGDASGDLSLADLHEWIQDSEARPKAA